MNKKPFKKNVKPLLLKKKLPELITAEKLPILTVFLIEVIYSTTHLKTIEDYNYFILIVVTVTNLLQIIVTRAI